MADFKYSDDLMDSLRYLHQGVKISNDGFEFFTVKPMPELRIKKVIFNEPATIVYWIDNSRTIVKCSEDDVFDPEKGLAMAICKRVLGEDFKKTFKDHLPEEEIKYPEISIDSFIKALNKLTEITKINRG